MEATRVRFGSILEWALAALVMAAVVAAASSAARQLRSVQPVTPVIAGEQNLYYEAPAGIPPRAVSVPLLLLENGLEVKIGDRASDVAARLGAAAKIVSESIEQSAVGERLIRMYSDAGVQFAVVYETRERSDEPRVAAIYLR